jgi:hypothetical protein
MLVNTEKSNVSGLSTPGCFQLAARSASKCDRASLVWVSCVGTRISLTRHLVLERGQLSYHVAHYASDKLQFPAHENSCC